MTKRCERARERRRTHASGAAFVEALLVIGLLVVGAACGLAMFELSLARHEVSGAARRLAFQSALEGCAQRSLATPFEATALQDGDATSGSLAGLSPDGQRVPTWFELSQNEGARVRRKVRAEIFGIDEVSATLRLPCNERGGARELDLGGAGSGQGERLLKRTLPGGS